MIKQVDVTAIKFNQAFIAGIVLLAYVLDVPWLVLGLAVVLGIGALWPQAALFQQLYHRVVQPAGLLPARVIADDPAPHRFAQGMGATFLLLASFFLLVVPSWIGWALALLVGLLAAINLVFSFCMGCFIYYQLTRIGVIRRPASNV